MRASYDHHSVCLHVVALWAVFSKFELVRWGWLSGTGSQLIVENEIALVGMFSQNGFQTINEGTLVDIVFDNAPGCITPGSQPFRRASVRGRSPWTQYDQNARK